MEPARTALHAETAPGRRPAGSERQSPSRRTRILGLVIVVAVFLYNLPIGLGALPRELPAVIGLVIFAALCVPFLFRHRWPVAVFVLTAATAFVQLSLGIDVLVADIMVLLTLCSLTLRFAWYFTVPALLASVVWVVVATQESLRSGYINVGDVGVLIALVVLAWTWSIVLKVRRQYVNSLEQRALDLEREQAAKERMLLAEERNRIAREIHDVVSHNLGSVVALSDGAIASVHSDPERAQQAMTMVRDTSSGALTEMRSMLGFLRSEDTGGNAPQPGIDQLEELVARTRRTGISVDFRTSGQRGALASGVELTVYRVIQEALTNTRKHAGQGSTAVVELTFDRDSVDVHVVDDGGRGAPGQSRDSRGHGLIGMRERVSAYGGTLETGYATDGGFRVHAWIPVGDQQ
ncbi:sensor histidine kinase [Kocuria atrinae]|uniref:sensor histidine kinase n=1 Tax=Kocuria atrinae TaxID=592377 RepID=UPI0031D3BC21